METVPKPMPQRHWTMPDRPYRPAALLGRAPCDPQGSLHPAIPPAILKDRDPQGSLHPAILAILANLSVHYTLPSNACQDHQHPRISRILRTPRIARIPRIPGPLESPGSPGSPGPPGPAREELDLAERSSPSRAGSSTLPACLAALPSSQLLAPQPQPPSSLPSSQLTAPELSAVRAVRSIGHGPMVLWHPPTPPNRTSHSAEVPL